MGQLRQMVAGFKPMKDIPFTFENGREIYGPRSGPCDLDGKSDRNALQERRYIELLFTFAIVGNDGVLAGPTERVGFKEGVGDKGDGAGWGTTVNLTNVQTNLLPSGSLNNAKNGVFVGRGFGAAVGRPFVYAPSTGMRTYSAAADAYAIDAMRGLAEATQLTLRQRDNAQNLELGRPQFWPGQGQVVRAGDAQFGGLPGNGIVTPFRDDYIFADDSKGSENQVYAVLPYGMTLLGDPAQPVPAGFSVPLLIEVYGQPVAVGDVCIPDGMGGVVFDPAGQIQKLREQGIDPQTAAAIVQQMISKLPQQ